MKQFNTEVHDVIKNTIRENMPDVKMLDASLCSDLDNQFFSYSWTDFKIASGSISILQWISKNGFKRVNKTEATSLLCVGVKCNDSGYWITGKTKNYWLKPN